jgi:hypothetical protein
MINGWRSWFHFLGLEVDFMILLVLHLAGGNYILYYHFPSVARNLISTTFRPCISLGYAGLYSFGLPCHPKAPNFQYLTLLQSM